MKVGLVNIALELFSNKKFNSVKNVIDMGTKEMRVSFDQLKYAFDQTNIKFNEKIQKLKIFPKEKEFQQNYFGRN